MTTSGRELVLWEQLANPHEHQMSLFRSDELYPAKPNSSVTAGVVDEDDLVPRQRHPEAVREEHERGPFPIIRSVEIRLCSRKIDDGVAKSMSRGVVHSALGSARARSVARYGPIDEQ